MAVKALIESQLLALNDPENFRLLQSSLHKVHEAFTNTKGDTLDSRTAIKKEVVRLDRQLRSSSNRQLFACNLLAVSAQVVARAAETTEIAAFRMIGRVAEGKKHPILALTIAKLAEKRMRLALKRVMIKAEMRNYVLTGRTRASRRIIAAAMLGNWLERFNTSRYAEILGRMRRRAQRAKALLRFRRFFFIQKCFWTVILQPKSQKDQQKRISSLFTAIQKLYFQRLQSVLATIKPSKPPSSPSARKVMKQTAFSRGPFKTINIKVLNSRTLFKWGVTQLVRTLAEIRQRNLEKVMVNMRNLVGKQGKMKGVLEKRMWMFRQYLRKSMQRRVNKWWQFARSKVSSKTLDNYKRQFALLRVLKDDSLQTCFTRWKDSNPKQVSYVLAALQVAISKLQRVRVRRVKGVWRKLRARGNTWELGVKTMERGLMAVIGNRMSAAVKRIYSHKGRRKGLFEACRKLQIVKKSKEIRDKYVALTLLNQHKRTHSELFHTSKSSKIKAVILLSGALANKVVKNLYHCWSCLVLRLRRTKDESTLRYFFEKLKQSLPIHRETVKIQLRAALQVIKSSQQYHLQRLMARWSMRCRLIRMKKVLGKGQFYPNLAKRLHAWYAKTLQWPWRKLARIRAKFQRVKGTALQLERRLTRVLLQRGLLKLMTMRAISAKEGRKMIASRTILQLSLKRQRLMCISKLKLAIKAAKKVPISRKRALAKLTKWANLALLPTKVHLFRHISAALSLRPGHSLCLSLLSPLQVQLLPVFEALKQARLTSLQARHKRIAAISLLHSHKAISTTAVLRYYQTWKGLAASFHLKAQSVKLLVVTLRGRLKTVLQQTLGTMRRAKYQLVALRDKGKNVYRLITLSEKEERYYGKLETFAKVMRKCRQNTILIGINAIISASEGVTLEPAKFQDKRNALLAKLSNRKDRRLCQAAIVLWRSSTQLQSSLLSTVLLGKAKAVRTLNIYRRKVLLVGCWSSLRRTAIDQYWKRKQATRVISDALITLKAAYLQAAFT